MIPSDFKKECSCKKLKASQKVGLHFKEQYDKEVIKNGELFIKNTALKQQLDEVTAQRDTYWELYSIEGKQAVKGKQILVEALEFIKNEPHLSCRGEYCDKDDCDSYAFCSHIIAKTALDKLNK